MLGYGAVPFDNAAEVLEKRLGGKAPDYYMHAHQAPYGWSLRLPWFAMPHSMFRTNRKRLNAVAIIVNVFVPWCLFCVVFSLVSFSVHFTAPATCFSVIAFLLVIFAGTFALMWQSARIRKEREAEEEEESEPMWYGFLCITSCLAIALGVLIGFHNYDVHMSTVFTYETLATYRDVDPASYVGQQLVDAGRVQFNDKSHIDISKSMAFKSRDMYCVAPIVSPKTNSKTFVDFWVVGKNCCSGHSADFHCEGFDNASFKGGLRLMDESERPFYRLAVQQAEATYKISTRKPLFFVWGADPVKYTDDLRHNGLMLYTMGILTAFVVQCFLVASATLAFSKAFPTRKSAHGHH